MKVIAVIKKGIGGSGISQATRYISRRDRDEDREGAAPRKLFSEREDSLSFHQANRLLGKGDDPRTQDLLHLVISLEKEEDFNQLGSGEESRQQALRDTTRDTTKTMAAGLNTDDLRWVAGIHRNTDNPHIHLLIHRDYRDRETSRTKRLKTLPKEMRVGWERAKDGSRFTDPGTLSRTFETFLEGRMEKARQIEKAHVEIAPAEAKKVHEERLILGRAIVAEEKIEQLTKRRDDAVRFGEQFRYEFTNGQGRRRGFSERDIHQRGQVKAYQLMAALPAILTLGERGQLRAEITASELARNEELLAKHRKTRSADLANIELKLSGALEASQSLIERAGAIRTLYEESGRPALIPILPRAKLAELEDRAIERGDAERVRRLEEIRIALAAETGSPIRTEDEVRRLGAQLFVVQSSLAAEQESAKRFEESKHLLRWDLPESSLGEGGREEPVRKSLAEIDRALVWAKDQAKFLGRRYVHWDDRKRGEAKIRIEQLSRERELVLDRIEAEHAEITDQVTDKAEFVAALYQIHTKHEQRHQSEGREMLAARFTLDELKELDTLASRLRDPDFYRTLTELEGQYDARTDERELVSLDKRAGRAQARAILAEINLRESDSYLARFQEHRDWIDLIVNNDGGRIVTLARLADVERKAPLERAFRRWFVEDDRHREVAAVVEAHGQKLAAERQKASEVHAFLVNEARNREEEFALTNPGRPLPDPRFTDWEISKLELHAAKEADPILKAKYEQLYLEALEREHEGHSRRIVIEKDADRLLDPVGADHQPAREGAPQLIPARAHVSYPDHQQEMTFER
ncbi:MAG: relaxase MobL [Acidobacteria bacterium]|nr:relaxase MobL [Acidobacteriota bacterium]